MRTVDRRAEARRSARGFTLMELMVAMAAGLVISITAFSFSRQATRAFAQESRLASAQMSVLAGFQRLQSDVARASYMSSPNINRDASIGRICGLAQWPAWLQARNLTGFSVTPQGSQIGYLTTALGDKKFPDTFRIMGNLSTSEAFTVVSIQQAGGGHQIFLRVNDGPASRAGLVDDDSLAAVFRVGRMVRVVDMQGRQQYAGIAASSWNSGQPWVQTSWPLPVKGDLTGNTPVTQAMCGIDGFGKESQVNVVNIVDYGIANLSKASITRYNNTVYSTTAAALGDDTRTELVRREWRVLDQAPPDFHLDQNAEIVAEYAVDLRAALYTSFTTATGCTPAGKGLARCDINSSGITTLMNVLAYGAYTPGQPATGPESVRGVRLRLVTRSREIDRKLDIDTTGLGMDLGEVFRYPVGTLGFARARTLMADVALLNQRGDAWF